MQVEYHNCSHHPHSTNTFLQGGGNDNGLSCFAWGAPQWFLLHLFAAMYPEAPSNVDKADFRTFLSLLGCVLPCGKCRTNFKVHAMNVFEDSAFDSRLQLCKAVFELHQAVTNSKQPNTSSNSQQQAELQPTQQHTAQASIAQEAQEEQEAQEAQEAQEEQEEQEAQEAHEPANKPKAQTPQTPQNANPETAEQVRARLWMMTQAYYTLLASPGPHQHLRAIVFVAQQSPFVLAAKDSILFLIKQTTDSSQQGCGTRVCSWTAPLWFSLHACARNYSRNPDESEAAEFSAYLEALGRVLPDCSSGLQETFARGLPKSPKAPRTFKESFLAHAELLINAKNLKSRKLLCRAVFDFQNAVAKEQGTQTIDNTYYQHVDAFYENMRAGKGKCRTFVVVTEEYKGNDLCFDENYGKSVLGLLFQEPTSP